MTTPTVPIGGRYATPLPESRTSLNARCRNGASTAARVCVFGEYSEARRAIVTDPNDWSKVTRVMKDDADAAVQRLRSRVVGRLIGGLVAAAAAAGVLAAFVSNAG